MILHFGRAPKASLVGIEAIVFGPSVLGGAAPAPPPTAVKAGRTKWTLRFRHLDPQPIKVRQPPPRELSLRALAERVYLKLIEPSQRPSVRRKAAKIVAPFAAAAAQQPTAPPRGRTTTRKGKAQPLLAPAIDFDRLTQDDAAMAALAKLYADHVERYLGQFRIKGDIAKLDEIAAAATARIAHEQAAKHAQLRRNMIADQDDEEAIHLLLTLMDLR